ncbi:hypothetical protein [Caldifermentibacillus hisashii]|uniref:hypothetical protein n=1 Tax=Caldifermentibacillus hisashii TaxID=996558 RepID=UPI003D241E46
MALHFELTLEDQDRMVNFLSSRYSDIEILSILRKLGLDKDNIYNKYVPKKVNCENLVDTVLQQELSEKLLLLLQSEKFFRSSFLEEFGHLKYLINEETFQNNTTKIYEKVVSSDSMPISEWIDSCKEKMVLILGKDSPNEYLRNLKKIADIVESIGYQPIIIKMEPEIDIKTNEEKMLTYAALARFVIIEKSEPAGQIDEAKICAFNRLPSIWIQKEGTGDTWMQGDYEVDFKNIKTFTYEESSLKQCLEKGIHWVEGFLKAKKAQLNRLYPWRSEN